MAVLNMLVFALGFTTGALYTLWGDMREIKRDIRRIKAEREQVEDILDTITGDAK